ncbi:MAG: hypothetical protein KDC80_13945 [Saprospiraceae bacterium]|nr:hypothetical protein [Saprospiraceae bacterium]
MKQSLFILIAIILGIIFPQGHKITFLIQYTLMIMLFFAFLGTRVNWNIFYRSHLIIGAFNILLPLIFYFLLLPLGKLIALTAFVCGIPPTAAAAPVLAQFMRTNVSYVTASVIITNPLVALCIPLTLPLLMPVDQPISVLDVLLPVFKVVGIPLLLASVFKLSSSKLTAQLLKGRMIAFYLFIFNVWMGCGNATNFLSTNSDIEKIFLVQVIFLTAIICVASFKLGAILVAKENRLAGSLALGRKNTMFGLWIALTFVNPLVALGPISYIIMQNAYNSYQIMIVEKKEKQLNSALQK